MAFLFLVFSKLSSDYRQNIKLKIEVSNLDDEIILINDSLNTIYAYIESKGLSLIPFLFNNSKTIVVDANKDLISTSKEFIFEIQKNRYLIASQMGDSYKVLSLKPDTLFLSYSLRASKLVPLVLDTDLSFALGFDIKGKINTNTDSIKVVGSLNEISDIKFIKTKLLQLSQVNSNINEEIQLIRPNNLDIFPKTIEVKAKVKRFTEGKIEVPIVITNKPVNVNLNFFPKSVMIYYYVDLESYKTIKPSDFSVECNYNNIGINQSFLLPQIVKKPDFVKRATLKQKRIDFIKL